MPITIETEEEFRVRHGNECYWVDHRRAFVFADGAQLDCQMSEAMGRPPQKIEPPIGSAQEMAELAYDYAFAKYDKYASTYNHFANTLKLQNQYHSMQVGPAVTQDEIKALKELSVKVSQLKVVADQCKREAQEFSKHVDWDKHARQRKAEARNVLYALEEMPAAFPTSNNVDNSDPNNYR